MEGSFCADSPSHQGLVSVTFDFLNHCIYSQEHISSVRSSTESSSYIFIIYTTNEF
uniref:Uncharacterized protein n=1 Tax=Lepeophtheirus salmonis TaxID=72036 RepID=A0A0K2UI07_LEPSM